MKMRLSRLGASMLICAAVIGQAAAALNAYVSIKGQKQGQIAGDSTAKGKEGLFTCFQIEHEIVSPRDPASGLPTGKRQHKPITLTFGLSKGVPLIYNSLVNNETLSVMIKGYSTSAAGTEVQDYTISLTNATISDIKYNKFNANGSTTADRADTVTVSFTYQKIEWTWVQGGITAMDDWSQ